MSILGRSARILHLPEATISILSIRLRSPELHTLDECPCHHHRRIGACRRWRRCPWARSYRCRYLETVDLVGDGGGAPAPRRRRGFLSCSCNKRMPGPWRWRMRRRSRARHPLICRAHRRAPWRRRRNCSRRWITIGITGWPPRRRRNCSRRWMSIGIAGWRFIGIIGRRFSGIIGRMHLPKHPCCFGGPPRGVSRVLFPTGAGAASYFPARRASRQHPSTDRQPMNHRFDVTFLGSATSKVCHHPVADPLGHQIALRVFASNNILVLPLLSQP